MINIFYKIWHNILNFYYSNFSYWHLYKSCLFPAFIIFLLKTAICLMIFHSVLKCFCRLLMKYIVLKFIFNNYKFKKQTKWKQNKKCWTQCLEKRELVIPEITYSRNNSLSFLQTPEKNNWNSKCLIQCFPWVYHWFSL